MGTRKAGYMSSSFEKKIKHYKEWKERIVVFKNFTLFFKNKQNVNIIIRYKLY